MRYNFITRVLKMCLCREATSYIEGTKHLPARSLHYLKEHVNFNPYTNVDGRVPVQFSPCIRRSRARLGALTLAERCGNDALALAPLPRLQVT